MSELINKNDNRATIRWKLLTGASALALSAYVSSTPLAHADDSSRPEIWIELGGALSRLGDGQETFAPSLMADRPSIFDPSQKFERPPLYSIDEFGSLSFQPEDSNWIFSASVRYGRSASKRHMHQQTYPLPNYHYKYFSGSNHRYSLQPIAAKFADTNAQNSETHRILDFQAGKDVGLGLFGQGGSSTLSAGVRFAQFGSRSTIALKSDPDWQFTQQHIQKYYFNFTLTGQPYHSNAAALRAVRSFHGIGPSLSWSASAPFAGNLQDGQLTVDWGVNAALLFGRQRTKVHHQTTAQYHPGGKYSGFRHTVGTPVNTNHTRSRSVTVPNVGGFAGISYQFTNAKLSLGYRADVFFGAIDGGIDAAKNEDRSFFGPYASLSIGLGD